MRVQVSGTSESTAVLRSYLHEAGDVVVWKDGDNSEPDYIVHLEERKAQEIYFESLQCDLERDIIRHVRQKSIVPIVLCGAPNNRPKHIIRIVFPPSQSPAVELGVQMGLADYVASKRKAATELVSTSTQSTDFGKFEEILGRFVDKIRPADSGNAELLKHLETLYERLSLEKDVIIEKLEAELKEARGPQPEVPASRPWWQFWKWIWTTVFLVAFVPIAKAQIYPIQPVILFTNTNPNGNACTYSSTILYYHGQPYTCSNNATYAVLSGGGGTWNSLTNPTGNLSLTMAADTSLFTYNATTGAAVDLFELTDTTNNTGTGNLLRSSTTNGSAAAPFRADANGIGWQVNSSGNLVNLSTATETVTQAGIAATSTDAIILANTTAATNAVRQQFSPRLRWLGTVWSGSATQNVEWWAEVLGSTTADSSDSLMFSPRINGVAQGTRIGFCSSGIDGTNAMRLIGLDGSSTSACRFNSTGFAGFGAATSPATNVFVTWANAQPINTFSPTGFDFGSAKIISWDSATDPSNHQTGDTGLCRSSASVLGINDGTATCTLSHFKTAIYQHTLSSGTAPTLTAGTGTIAGGDQGFRVTLTAGSQTTITVTFGTAYTTNIPVFTCNDETTAANNPVQTQPTLSTVVINATGTFGAADKISCHGTGIIGI